MRILIVTVFLLCSLLPFSVSDAHENHIPGGGRLFTEGDGHILYVPIPKRVSKEAVLHPTEAFKYILYGRVRQNVMMLNPASVIKDLIVIYTDHDGQPILPDLEAQRRPNASKPFVPAGNELTFTFDSAASPWTEKELETLTKALNDFYPVAKTIYGEPAFNITVNVRKDPSSAFSGEYSPTMNEIVLRDVSQLDVLCHEMIHAFRDDDMITINTYEEGMTRAVEVEVFNRLGGYTFWNENHSYMYDVYYDGLNRQAGGLQAGNFDYASPFLLLRYELTGYAWAKVFFENSQFFIDFNRTLYDRTLTDPSIRTDEAKLRKIAASLQPVVEGTPFLTWYEQQGILYPVLPAGYSLYQNISNLNVYYFYRNAVGSESVQPGKTIYWEVYDYLDRLVDGGDGVTSALGWISINPALPIDYRGRIKIVATVSSPDGLIVNTVLTSVGQDIGIFGIVAESDSGTVTITPLDYSVPPIKAEVIDGAFSAPSFSYVRGRFIANYSDNKGQTFSKQFNKDASSYFLSMDKSGGTAGLSISQTGIPGRLSVESNLTYFVTVRNNGPDSASEVLVMDTLPDGVTFVSATPSQGICTFSVHVVACALNTLANGSSATVAIVVVPGVTGSMRNVAEVSSNVYDPYMADNSAILMSEVTASVFPVTESIGMIVSAVGDLVDEGILNQGQGNGLISVLKIAIVHILQDNVRASIDELAAFIQHLSAFERAGIVERQRAEALITMANGVIADLRPAKSLK